ncbi:hypothetical protein PAUR_a4593 [Pseudoalteromonas aurantia 208]|uniref:Uncharacterized protein n=1 Tax=Pseudoalteromonas aurantia 208 TaxID=1314867 RepID=A0ABR9EJT4_9GAMM|nr:hypothetical protein [Pseudoalteromonas aurantia 208]
MYLWDYANTSDIANHYYCECFLCFVAWFYQGVVSWSILFKLTHFYIVV